MEQPAPGAYSERHFRVRELAAQLNVSPDTIRRLFRNEPGVLVLTQHNPGKRAYQTLLIPASVAERVHRRFSLAKENDF
jgi:DeoR/GlpR family transcriptional regulator of sugar metabolism